MPNKKRSSTRLKARPSTREADVPISSSKTYAYFSYLFILVLFSFLFGPRDAFTRFHVRQGLVLFVFEAITIMVSPIIPPVALVAWAAWVVLSLMGLFAVMQGEKKALPLVSKYTKSL